MHQEKENCLSQYLIPFFIESSQFIHHKGRSLFIILLHNLIKFHKNLSGLSISALLRHKSTQNDIMLSQRHSLATNKGKMEQRNKELACRRSNQGWRDLKNIYWTKNLDLMWHYQFYWDLDLNNYISLFISIKDFKLFFVTFQVVVEYEKCHCKFVWCCKVQCKQCKRRKLYHTCHWNKYAVSQSANTQTQIYSEGTDESQDYMRMVFN